VERHCSPLVAALPRCVLCGSILRVLLRFRHRTLWDRFSTGQLCATGFQPVKADELARQERVPTTVLVPPGRNFMCSSAPYARPTRRAKSRGLQRARRNGIENTADTAVPHCTDPMREEPRASARHARTRVSVTAPPPRTLRLAAALLGAHDPGRGRFRNAHGLHALQSGQAWPRTLPARLAPFEVSSLGPGRPIPRGLVLHLCRTHRRATGVRSHHRACRGMN
jgi:hypothetical protein